MFLHDELDSSSRFRERRRRARRRPRGRRAATVGALLAVAPRSPSARRSSASTARDGAGAGRVSARTASPFRAIPAEIRGVDVTVALGSLPGKVRGYGALRAVGPNEAENLRG